MTRKQGRRGPGLGGGRGRALRGVAAAVDPFLALRLLAALLLAVSPAHASVSGVFLHFQFTMPYDPPLMTDSTYFGTNAPLRVAAEVWDEFGVEDTLRLFNGPSLASGPPVLVRAGRTQTIYAWCNADSVARRIRVVTIGHWLNVSGYSNPVDYAVGTSPWGATYWDYPFYDLVPSACDRHCCSFAHSPCWDTQGAWVVTFRLSETGMTSGGIGANNGQPIPLPHIRISGRP